MKLTVINDIFSIYRLPNNAECPNEVLQSEFYTISKTEDELSIVCSERIEIKGSRVDGGWACIKIVGSLDFSLVGILAQISNTLAENNISIFAISTFNTDYILVKKENLEKAKTALENKGYSFVY